MVSIKGSWSLKSTGLALRILTYTLYTHQKNIVHTTQEHCTHRRTLYTQHKNIVHTEQHCTHIRRTLYTHRRTLYTHRRTLYTHRRTLYTHRRTLYTHRRTLYTRQKNIVHTSEEHCTHVRRTLYTRQKNIVHTSEEHCTHVRRTLYTRQKNIVHTSEEHCTHRRTLYTQKNIVHTPRDLNWRVNTARFMGFNLAKSFSNLNSGSQELELNSKLHTQTLQIHTNLYNNLACAQLTFFSYKLFIYQHKQFALFEEDSRQDWSYH
ncbi:hypothetical protein OTU49_011970 [Cherax quadricarinatus]|uniref:Uncharacterized protein n=1 Tax=Cherax quadricarinatus TaxID=27406 RepID=A0AAW0W3U0_CHEQU